MTLKEKVFKKLEKVYDPELNISVVDLGLIYDVLEEKGKIKIKMTLTSFGCPLFQVLEKEIKNSLQQIKGVQKVEIELTFNPPWSPEKMTEKGKTLLGFN